MVFPKLTLIRSAFTCLSRYQGFIAKKSIMKIPKSNFSVLDILFFDLTTRVSGPAAAVRSLVIAEFDHHDRSVFIPFEMPGLGNNRRHHFLV